MSENNEFNMQDLHNEANNEPVNNQNNQNEQSYNEQSNNANQYGYYNQANNNTPYYTPVEPQQKQNSGYAIASLVLGILSILCCGTCGIIMGILAIVFCYIDKNNNNGQTNSLARAGMICGIIALVCSVIYLILYFTVLAESMQELMNGMM